MLTVVHENDQSNDGKTATGRSLLDEIVRDGARQMLAAALKAEVAAYIDQFADDLCREQEKLCLLVMIGVRTEGRKGTPGPH